MPEILAFQSRSPSGQPRRTTQWVVDWFLSNDVQMKNTEARKERARVLRLFCAFFNGDGRGMGPSHTDECIGADLVEFLNKCCPKGQWTRRRWCNTVKRPFREAAKLGLITYSPFQAVTERRGGRGRDMTWDEFRGMLRLATPAMRRVLLFARFSGARPEEMRTLEKTHFNALSKQIVKRVHKTVNSTSEPLPRVIPLSGHLLRLLLWMIRNHPHGGKWVFTNSYGGQWKTRALCKNVKALREKASLPADVKLYGCRHAFITEAILNDIDIATIAEIVGHRSILTTQTYLHLSGKKDHLAAAMEKAVHFNGPKPPAQTETQRLIELLTALLAKQL